MKIINYYYKLIKFLAQSSKILTICTLGRQETMTQALTQNQAEVSSLLLIAMCVARIVPWVMNDQNILDIDTCNNDNNYDIDAKD